MPPIHRNQCRVCLSPGYKSLFSTSNTQTTELNCDRLAEKLRFVSMQTIADSPSLPNMLCYGCIVQLNLAYNFKNIVIDTHMYLERHIIESGVTGSPPTPAISTAATCEDEDEDNQSLLSSISRQPQLNAQQPPPPPSTVSLTATESIVPSQTIPTAREETRGGIMVMLDPSQIKREVEDEATQIFRRVLDINRSALVRDFGNGTKEPPRTPKRKSAPMSNTAVPTPPQAKKTNNNMRQPSPRMRPMVAVQRIVIDKNSEQDKQYLDRILRTQTQGSSAAQSHVARTILGTFSNYDFNNSKMIQELFNNLPKSRLRRARRTST